MPRGLPPDQRLNARRALRQASTRIEQALWNVLRDRRFEGLKFRRQVSIGPYIADFYCEAHRLVVEADGPVHADPDQSTHDAIRDRWLTEAGYRVVRLPENEILTAMSIALARIEKVLLSIDGN